MKFFLLVLFFAFFHVKFNFCEFYCDLSENKEASSAISRATSKECKDEIERVSCELQNGTLFNYTHVAARLCPSQERIRLGCIDLAVLSDFFEDVKNNTFVYDDIFTNDLCYATCITYNNHYYLFDEELSSCKCFFKVKSSIIKKYTRNNLCENGGLDIYSTGLPIRKAFNESYVKRDISFKIRDIPQNSIRIVFLFTINGRSLRHVQRIFKLLYHRHHFYYFHVDAKSLYLRNELEKLEAKFPSNVHVSKSPFSTIWGGAQLLDMHLAVMKHIFEFSWEWDFLINLSETDFPIKSLSELTEYLNQNQDMNFLKFHSTNPETFVHKQGLNRTFLQCDDHMWRIGNRKLLPGIQIDGGSDWFCLKKDFISYVINSNDDYINGLKHFFKYTLLPSEAFFQSALINSPFCTKYINSNLRHVNWIRERGCGCSYFQVVDWCGCSPNVYTYEDIKVIEELKTKPIFLARKFDPLINQQIINKVDQSIYGIYSGDFPSLNSYWHNEYDSRYDKKIDKKYEVLFKSFMKLISKNIGKQLLFVTPSSSQFNSIMVEDEEFLMKYLESVHSFFEADNFQGFILTIKIPFSENNFLKFEVFFKSLQNKKKFYSNDEGIRKYSTKEDLLLDSLIQFKIGTDYDKKEYLLRNYAGVINQESNPILLMQFDELLKPLKMLVRWLDPTNKVQKETKIRLNVSEDEQIISHALFRLTNNNDTLTNHSITPGIWHASVSSLSEDENKTLTTVASKFLVLPIITDEYEINQTTLMTFIEKFWVFDKFCMVTNNLTKKGYFLSFFDEIIDDCKSSFWSTFYPDPKSDLNENNEINSDVLNLKFRLF